MNPLNVLIDLVPTKQRKFVYAIVALILQAFAVWQASKGDWTVFAAGEVGSLTTAVAHANAIVPGA